MRSDNVICANCGAHGVKGAQCPYCGSLLPTDEDCHEKDTANLIFGSLIGLPDTYVIEISVGQNLYIVKSTENNCNKYGVYNADSARFELEPIFSSILPCGNGNYIAMANILTDNNEVMSKSVKFSSISGYQVINITERRYQQKESIGCVYALMLCIITTVIYIII